MSLLGALGDIHGDFAAARRVMARHPDVGFWLCVGDLADSDGRYEALPAPLYWIKGNNENFDTLAAGRFPANLHYLPNAHLETIGGLRVAGLGGTLAPTWYDTPAADLPYPRSHGDDAGAARTVAAAEPRPGQGPSRDAREGLQPSRVGKRERAAPGVEPRRVGEGGAPRAPRDDKRRHFVREEVERCKALRDIDVLLTHEAPRPYLAGAGPRRNDAGKTPINEILAAVKPRLHLFGHHHRFTDQERQGVRSVGLDLVGRSYLLIDRDSLELTLLDV
jgi:predicted phosphodiesterase